eukprot:1155106-Pelagomonas_calceolata.AAC.4
MALILAFPVPRGIPGIAVTHRTIPHLLSFHFQGPVASTQRFVSGISNAPPSSGQQRQARMALLEEERSVALETAALLQGHL